MSTQPPTPPSEDREPAQRQISWTSPEIFGELILLGVIMVLMIVYLTELPGLREEARWLPLIVIGLGTPLWIIRLVTILRRQKLVAAAMIMDLGFRVGADPAGERIRALRFVLSLTALYVGVWGIGFHIGLPLWVSTYLIVFSQIRVRYVSIVILGFWAFILGITDWILDIEWFEPFLFRLVNWEYPFNDWPISGTF
jgi:hypothetical protein